MLTCAGKWSRDLQWEERLLSARGGGLSQARAPIYEALERFRQMRICPV